MGRIRKELKEIGLQLLRGCGLGRYLCLNSEAEALSRVLRIHGLPADIYKGQDVAGCNYNILILDSPHPDSWALFYEMLPSIPHESISYVAFISKKEVERVRPEVGLDQWKQIINEGFHLHKLSSKFRQFSSKAEYLIFRREAGVSSNTNIIPEDLFRQFGLHSDKLSKALYKCGDFVPDRSRLVISGYYAGVAGYIIRTCTLPENIIELHLDERSRNYFNQMYPNPLICRQTINYIGEMALDKVDICFHFPTQEPERELKLIEKLVSLLPNGGRLILIINRIELDQQGWDEKYYLSVLNSLFHRNLIKDVFKHPHDRAAPIFFLGVKVPEFIGRAQKRESSEKGLSHPWVSSSMITMGKRLNNPKALKKHALTVLNISIPLSAQEGAALCVILYRYLEKLEGGETLTSKDLEKLERVQAFLEEAPSDDRSILRWLISLSYACGQFYHLIGEEKKAEAYYQQCVSYDPLIINPQMAGKTLHSFINLGRYAYIRKDLQYATLCFKNGLELTKTALGNNWEMALGSNPNRPHRFGLPEIVNVAQLGAKCANALNAISIPSADQGITWTLIEGLK